MSIKDWPAHERPREKLLHRGPQALSDAELLAIFLRTGCAGLSAIDLARSLIERFGSLRAILESDLTSFCQGLGLGTAKYAQLQATLEMGRRHLQEALEKGDALTSPELTRQYLIARLGNYPQEVFACLYLDNQHRMIRYQQHFYGTIDGANVHPREIVRAGLGHNAAAVIMAHNHPSGIAEPSQSDIDITRTLKSALSLVDIRLLDHVIVADRCAVSLAEKGLL